jgi:septum formation protein
VTEEDRTLLLASTSPRRRELLSQAGFTFQVIPPGSEGVDETPYTGEAPRSYVERLARAKAQAGYAEARRRGIDGRLLVLGADTTVAVGATLLGKPADADQARQMLVLLSGRSHEVLTGLCIHDGHRQLATVSVSRVRFRALSEDDIAEYVASGEPFDKAGGYGIQGRAALMVSHLEGSYSGVMGLPLFEFGALLGAFGQAGPTP